MAECPRLFPHAGILPSDSTTLLASFVDLLAGQADVGDGRSDILFGNITFPFVAMPLHLAPLLRGVVLVVAQLSDDRLIDIAQDGRLVPHVGQSIG